MLYNMPAEGNGSLSDGSGERNTPGGNTPRRFKNMRRITKFMAPATFAAMAMASVCMADDNDGILTIGDTAPKLDIAHWVKGDAIPEFKEGNVYVVEYWATWCGPCRMSMPHLSELQKHYEDYPVTIVGISDEALPTVVNFLCTNDKQSSTMWNEKIGYTLATDPDKSTHKDYMDAAGQRGIPTAFVVGMDGKIEWIGHPMEMDEPLEQIVKDTWDREKFKVTWEKEQAASRERAKVERELRAARERGDYETILKQLDAILAQSNDIDTQMAKFSLLLVDMKKPDEAYDFAETIVKTNWENHMALNEFAWFVVDRPNLPKRDLDLALKAAHQASKLRGDKDSMILDTVARGYYEKGDLKAAVQWQRKAVESLTPQDGAMAGDIKATLEKYEKEAG
jgi:thiol-disulfide isomerase/thioredoxin